MRRFHRSRRSIWTGRVADEDSAFKPVPVVPAVTLKAAMERQWSMPGCHDSHKANRWITPMGSGGYVLPGLKDDGPTAEECRQIALRRNARLDEEDERNET